MAAGFAVPEPGLLDAFYNRLYDELIVSLKQCRGGPFAAGVVMQKRMVATGTNSVLRDYDLSHHAEINALSAAEKSLKKIHLYQGVLITTHFPCLMCYHALKWAGITRFYYIFSHRETKSLFGFKGDSQLLSDLNILMENLTRDPSVEFERYESETVKSLYFDRLVDQWHREYKETCSSYDI